MHAYSTAAQSEEDFEGIVMQEKLNRVIRDEIVEKHSSERNERIQKSNHLFFKR